MNEWLTAAELAGLQGLPSSERRTREWLDRIGVPSRQRPGRLGGGGREFDTAALPPETRKALLARRLKEAALPPQLEAASPTESFTVAAPSQSAVSTQLAGRRPPSRADAACADARTVVVRQLMELVDAMGSITRAAAALSDHLVEDDAAEALVTAAKAANLRPRIVDGRVRIKPRTLFLWHAAYTSQGWWGLLPKPVAPTALTAVGDDVAAVIKAYASAKGSARNLTEVAQAVTRALGRPFDDWRRLYDQARRAMPKVDKVQMIKARHTGAERAARLPFKRRDTSLFSPLDIGVIDGHSFKAKVRHPDHGQPFAPEVSIVKDAATRKITGWSVSLSESTMAVGAAITHSVSTHGVHAMIYSDNGAGETGMQLDCPVDGLYARLGTEHRTGKPGHPQARGILERSWRTHMIRCARQFDTYQGKDVDRASHRQVTLELQREQRAVDRARKTGDVVTLSRRVPSWQQFIAAIEQAVHEYNSEHRHRSLPKHSSGPHAGLHMTPNEAWDAMLVPDLVIKPAVMEVRALFMPSALRTAQRGEVQFLNQVYASDELMQVDGERVSVRYDVHDPSRVFVWTVSGQFVCEAKLDANKSDFFPKSAVEAAREKRVRGMVKRAQQRMDTALRELGPTVPEGGAAYLGQADMAPTTSLPLVERVEPEPAVQAAAAAGPVRPFFESASERYEWLLAHRDQWIDADASWLATYVAGPEYEALAEYYAGRGLSWVEGAQGFKTAG